MSSRALTLLCLMLAAAPAFANCEVGGYLIHTVAEYKTCEPQRFVLPYWKESASRLGFAETGIRCDHSALRGPKLSLSHGNQICSRTAYSQVDRYKAPNDIEYRLDAPRCGALLENLPSHGYAFLDATQRTLRFTDALPIGILELDASDRAALEAEIEAQLPGLTLYAESGILGQMLRGRIEPGDIASTQIETMTVGFGQRPFVMAIAVLTLRNLDRLYGGLEWLPADLAPRLRINTIEYPVIFFRPSSGSARYVGDGSSCASTRAFRGDPQPETTPQLGAVERFRITGAFDSNDDGAPDVLEVNDRFAYLLEPDGRLFVVRFGLGC